METKRNIIDFSDGYLTKQLKSPLFRNDYGQELIVTGINFPSNIKTIPVYFSLHETRGEAEPMLGVVQNNVLVVDIPDFVFQKDEIHYREYYAYAFIYVDEGTSGETVRKVVLPVNSAPKMKEPTDIKPWQEVLEQINKTAQKSEGFSKVSESFAHGQTGTRENEETDNAKYYKEQADLDAQATEADRQEVAQNKEHVDGVKQAVDISEKNVRKDTEQVAQDKQDVTLVAEGVKNDRTAVETAKKAVDKTKQEIDLVHKDVTEKTEQVKKDAEKVAQDKEQVAQDRTHADDVVKEFGTVASDAVDAVNKTGTEQLNTIIDAGTKTVKSVTDEGTKQTKLVSDKGVEQIKAVQDKGIEQVKAVVEEGTKQKKILDDTVSGFEADKEQIQKNKQEIENIKINDTGVSLGILNASIGQIIEVEQVDETGKPIKWKAVAKPNNKWELIDTIILKEEGHFLRDTEPDGTPYKFKRLYTKVKVPTCKVEGWRQLTARTTWGGCYYGEALGMLEKPQYFGLDVLCEENAILSIGLALSAHGDFFTRKFPGYRTYPLPIKVEPSIKTVLSEGTSFPAGTEILIYAIR